MRTVIAIVAWLIAGCGAPKLSSDASLPLDKRFQAELEALHSEFKIPGATAAYVLADGSVGTAAVGMSDVESATPMGKESRMLAASTGKSLVGAWALALAAEGRVGLDDLVQEWLGDKPWFRRLPNHQAITVRHLLTHSAGLTDHVYNEDFQKAMSSRWRDPDAAFAPEELIQFVLDKKALFEPGADWAYTDTGYILLGLVLEKASGSTFYDEVTRRFLKPLDLSLTEPSNKRELSGLAAGYTPKENPMGLPVKSTVAPGVMAWNPGIEWTGGGFVSHPRDLVKWAKALYEGHALQGDYRRELFNSVPVTGFFVSLITGKIRYGAGVGIFEKTNLGPIYGHGGGIPGYTSSMRYYADHQFAVSFQVNTDVDPDSFASDIESRLAHVVAASLKK